MFSKKKIISGGFPLLVGLVCLLWKMFVEIFEKAGDRYIGDHHLSLSRFVLTAVKLHIFGFIFLKFNLNKCYPITLSASFMNSLSSLLVSDAPIKVVTWQRQCVILQCNLHQDFLHCSKSSTQANAHNSHNKQTMQNSQEDTHTKVW